MNKEELILEERCVLYARTKGIVTIKGNPDEHRGIPDRQFLKDGITAFVEFKVGRNKRTKAQYDWERWCKNNNFPYLCTKSQIEFIYFINKTFSLTL
jgi:hypothetical protein